MAKRQNLFYIKGEIMKKFCIVLILLFIGVGVVVLANIFSNNHEADYLRVHIRANSNLIQDQNVKYKIKDQVVDYLTPLFLDCKTKQQAYYILQDNLANIERVADKVLVQEGFTYTCKAKLNNEYFPTRAYQELVLESGFYDALILELGEAKGDNWWCVVYPPLCFVEDQKNIEYKSKFIEIIKQIF